MMERESRVVHSHWSRYFALIGGTLCYKDTSDGHFIPKGLWVP